MHEVLEYFPSSLLSTIPRDLIQPIVPHVHLSISVYAKDGRTSCPNHSGELCICGILNPSLAFFGAFVIIQIQTCPYVPDEDDGSASDGDNDPDEREEWSRCEVRVEQILRRVHCDSVAGERIDGYVGGASVLVKAGVMGVGRAFEGDGGSIDGEGDCFARAGGEHAVQVDDEGGHGEGHEVTPTERHADEAEDLGGIRSAEDGRVDDSRGASNSRRIDEQLDKISQHWALSRKALL